MMRTTTFVAAAVLLCILDSAYGGLAPHVTIGVNGGTHGTIGGLEPTLKWTAATTAGPFDCTGGVNVVIQELKTIPKYSLWGKLQRSVTKELDVSARADISDDSLTTVDLDLRAEGDIAAVQVLATVGSNNCISKLQVKKSFIVNGRKLTILPRLHVPTRSGDVTIGYDVDSRMSLIVDASKTVQKLTVSRAVGDKTRVTTSRTTKGDFTMNVEQTLDIGSKVTTTLKPNHSVNVKWEDGPWVANIEAPLEGYRFNQGVNVSVKRKVDVF